MEYGIFIGMIIKLHEAYINCYTHKSLKRALAGFGKLVQSSLLATWFSDHTSFESDYEKSVFIGIFRRFNLDWLKPLLENSAIMRMLLNERILRGLVLIQIFSYIFLPTMISVLLSLGVFALLILHKLVSPDTKRKPKLFIASMAIIVVLMAYSLVMNQVSSDGFSIWLIYASTFLFSAGILGTYTDQRFLNDVMIVIAILVGITGLHGIYQRIVGVPVDPAWLDEEATGLGIRIYSVFGNPNVYGEFLVLTLPLMFAGFNQYKRLWVKLIYGGIFALGGLNVLLTLSRGSMMSLAIALVLVVLFKDRKYLPVLVVGVLLSPYFVPQSIIDRILTIFQGGDTSTSYRVSIYTASLDMLKDYVVEGVGLGNFKVLYKAYAYSAAKSFHAHNTLLMIMIELGLVGFAAWILYFTTWLKEIFSAQKSVNRYGYFAFAAFAGIVGCTVQGMVDHVFHNYDILFFYVLMMTFGVIAAQIAREEGDEHGEN